MPSPGYGYRHQRERARALAAMPDGTPCPICRLPMRKTQRLDYDHVVPIVLGGIDGPKRIVHASCNRSRGSSLGNRLRPYRRKGIANAKRPSRRLPSW